MSITKKVSPVINVLLISLIFGTVSDTHALTVLSDEILRQTIGQAGISSQVLAPLSKNTTINTSASFAMSRTNKTLSHTDSIDMSPSTIIDTILNNLPLQFSVIMSQIYNLSTVTVITSNNESQIAIHADYIIPYFVLSNIHINFPLQSMPVSAFFGSLGFVNIHIHGTIYY